MYFKYLVAASGSAQVASVFGIVDAMMVGRYIGIALAHLYVANEITFRFFKAADAPEVPGYGYVGSVTVK